MCDSLVSLLLWAVWVTDVMASAEAAILELELKAVAVKVTPPGLGHLPTGKGNKCISTLIKPLDLELPLLKHFFLTNTELNYNGL